VAACPEMIYWEVSIIFQIPSENIEGWWELIIEVWNSWIVMECLLHWRLSRCMQSVTCSLS